MSYPSKSTWPSAWPSHELKFQPRDRIDERTKHQSRIYGQNLFLHHEKGKSQKREHQNQKETIPSTYSSVHQHQPTYLNLCCQHHTKRVLTFYSGTGRQPWKELWHRCLTRQIGITSSHVDWQQAVKHEITCPQAISSLIHPMIATLAVKRQERWSSRCKRGGLLVPVDLIVQQIWKKSIIDSWWEVESKKRIKKNKCYQAHPIKLWRWLRGKWDLLQATRHVVTKCHCDIWSSHIYLCDSSLRNTRVRNKAQTTKQPSVS